MDCSDPFYFIEHYSAGFLSEEKPGDEGMIFNVHGHIEMIRKGTKTQTRRLNRGIYKIGNNYAVQIKRGVKAEEDIRIVMNNIWLEKADLDFILPNKIQISSYDARAEGDYIPFEYEQEFKKAYPKWDGLERWVFTFHAIEVQK